METVAYSTSFSNYLRNLTKNQIQKFRNLKNKNKPNNTKNADKELKILPILLLFSTTLLAQDANNPKAHFFSQPGIIITIILILIPILLGSIFAIIKANNAIKAYQNNCGERRHDNSCCCWHD